MRYAFLNQSDFICVKEYCCVSSAASDSDLRDLLCVCVWGVWMTDGVVLCPFFPSALCFVNLTHLFPEEQTCCSTTTVNTHARARTRTLFEKFLYSMIIFFFFFLWTCWIKSHSAWLLLHRNPLCDIMYSVNICALSVTGSTQISQRNKILFYINSTA